MSWLWFGCCNFIPCFSVLTQRWLNYVLIVCFIFGYWVFGHHLLLFKESFTPSHPCTHCPSPYPPSMPPHAYTHFPHPLNHLSLPISPHSFIFLYLHHPLPSLFFLSPPPSIIHSPPFSQVHEAQNAWTPSPHHLSNCHTHCHTSHPSPCPGF